MYSDEYYYNQKRIFPRCTQVQNRGHDIYRSGRHERRRKRGCCNKGTATDTKRSQEGEKALNFGLVHILDADGEQVLCYNTYNLFVRLPEQEVPMKQPDKMTAYFSCAAKIQTDLHLDNQMHRLCHAAVKGGDGK